MIFLPNPQASLTMNLTPGKLKLKDITQTAEKKSSRLSKQGESKKSAVVKKSPKRQEV